MSASEQLRGLGEEISTRGSMLRSAGESWLSRHHGLDSSSAGKLISESSGQFFSIKNDKLFPAKENPSGRKLDGIAANPTPAQGASKKNPISKSKGGNKSPETKSGGRASPSPSTKQETSPMAAKRKTGKKPAAKKARKTTGRKKPRSAAQKAATKRMLAANKKSRKAKAPKAAPKARRVKGKRRSAAKKPRATRKPARRRATTRRTGAASQHVSVKVEGTKPTRRTTRRKGATKRRATHKKPAVRRTRTTTRTMHRKGGGIRTVTTRDVMVGRRNPVNDAKHMTVGIVAIAAGFGTAELLDRLTVSMVNVPRNADGTSQIKDKDGKDVNRLTGFAALVMRHTVPTWQRFAVSGGGALLLGGSAYMLRRKSAWGTTILGGLAIGFGFKLAGLGMGYLLPKMLPVTNQTEDTWVNEIFPENASSFDLGNKTTNQKAILDVTSSGLASGTPPWRRNISTATRQSFGPVASGQLGKTCSCGCGHEQGSPCSCPKAQAPLANAALRKSGAPGAEAPTAASGQLGDTPTETAKPSTVVQIGPRRSLTDVLAVEASTKGRA